jgi:hypothetical protein
MGKHRWMALVLLVGCGGTPFAEGPDTDAGAPEIVDAPMADAGVEADVAAEADAGGEADAKGDAAPSDEGGSDGPTAEGLAPVDASDEHAADAPAEGCAPDAPAREDGGDDAAPEGCSPVLYFLDGDGDGYGGTTTSQGCAPPEAGTWVGVGGDCDDSNPVVNPGQTAFFAHGYVPTGKTGVSFDYDCDGQESESGATAKADCQVVGLACVGSGYVEAAPARSGAGVDPFCGSTSAVTCAFSGLVCKAGPPDVASPITCR